jgi:C-terminal processing protease CtpA/Prc
MVVRAEKGRTYPVIRKIVREGAASEHPTIQVGDELLEVDGVSCADKSAEVLLCLVLLALSAVSSFLSTHE